MVAIDCHDSCLAPSLLEMVCPEFGGHQSLLQRRGETLGSSWAVGSSKSVAAIGGTPTLSRAKLLTLITASGIADGTYTAKVYDAKGKVVASGDIVLSAGSGAGSATLSSGSSLTAGNYSVTLENQAGDKRINIAKSVVVS